jgi:hypothetical protein
MFAICFFWEVRVESVQAGVSPGFDGQDEQTQNSRRKCHLPEREIAAMSQNRVWRFGAGVSF